MTISFENKVVIVTGSGGGLGRCHALQFAQRGAKLVINDLGGAVDGSGGSSEAADKVVQEIKDMGGEAISNGSSVTDKEGVQCWNVPPEAMIEDAINAVSVVYMAGQNSSRDKNNPNTVYFIPKSNPIRLGNSVELLNNIETFTTQVTALGL